MRKPVLIVLLMLHVLFAMAQVPSKISGGKRTNGHAIFMRQPDGKFIYFTGTGGNFYSGRIYANGNNDDGYNGVRTAATLLGDYVHCRTLGIGFDKWNRMLVCGTSAADSTSPAQATLVRYTRSGDADIDFVPGVLRWPVRDTSELCGVQLLLDEKILVAGSAYTDGYWRFFIGRLLYNGEVDTSFAHTGYIIDDSAPESCRAIGTATQNDGKMLIAGSWKNGDASGIHIARYYPSGTKDETFGVGGSVTTNLALWGSLMPVKMLLQPDGNILVAGTRNNADGGSDIFAARFTQWGIPDTSFGKGGIETIDVSFNDRLDDLILLGDGDIVLSGSGNARGEKVFPRDILLRYDSRGKRNERYGYGPAQASGLSATFRKEGFRVNGHTTAYAPSENKIYRLSEMVSGDGRETLLTLNVFLLDTGLGVIDVPNRKEQRSIYPVAVGDKVTLTYEMIDDQKVTIKLRDAAGKELWTAPGAPASEDGEYVARIPMPARTAARAFYEIELTTAEGYKQVVEVTR
ncbi:MAG: hypothetical protein KF744_15905 [Taibaiella sp.]|nr:hypothetical protein [Taibaiella sp.]